MSEQSEMVMVQLNPATRSRLEQLARHTGRSESYLMSEAIAEYAARELEIVEGIKRGLADIEAGRTVSHEVAMRRIRATVQRAGSKE